MTPSAFRPAKASQFIGAAAKVAALLTAKAERLHAAGEGTLKVLFYGPPGVGKTELAWLVARQLAGHHLAIEHVNGKEVTLETVRRWMDELATGSLFGDWQVKVVDELDRCSRDAQDLLLTYLDRLPDTRAFIGTSNLQLDLLQERFQTRLQQFRLDNASTEEVTRFLMRFDLTKDEACQIAVGCGGNVRAALLDAESYLDAKAISAPKRRPTRRG
jgi:replication-associated recombination protein RarA